jgi:hypothetical protein
MKCRKGIALALAAALAVVWAHASAQEEAPSGLWTDNPQVEETVTDPVYPDEDGTVALEEDALLDIVLPETIRGKPVQAIGAGAFQGCEIFRTVTIPACVTEIGENAFADCPGLEAIILEGRADAEGLTLGENWSGDAAVLFGLVAQPDPEETPADSEDAEPEDGEPENAELTESEAAALEDTGSEDPEPVPSAPKGAASEDEGAAPEDPEPVPAPPQETDSVTPAPEPSPSEEAEPEPSAPETAEEEPAEPTQSAEPSQSVEAGDPEPEPAPAPST